MLCVEFGTGAGCMLFGIDVVQDTCVCAEFGTGAGCVLFDIAVVEAKCVCADAVGCADWFACGCVIERSPVTSPMDDAGRSARDNSVDWAGGCAFIYLDCCNRSGVCVFIATCADSDSRPPCHASLSSDILALVAVERGFSNIRTVPAFPGN